MERATRKETRFYLDLEPGSSRFMAAQPQLFHKALAQLVCKTVNFTSQGLVQISIENSSPPNSKQPRPPSVISSRLSSDFKSNNSDNQETMLSLTDNAHSHAADSCSPVSYAPSETSRTSLAPRSEDNREPLPGPTPRLFVKITEKLPDASPFNAIPERQGVREKSRQNYCEEFTNWERLEFPPCSIMVVDHYGETHISVKRALKKYNFAWVHIYNIGQLLESVQKFNPDLILLDMRQPGKDITQAVQQLRDWERRIHQNAMIRGRASHRGHGPDEELQTIPVLAVATKTSKEEERQIILSGCNDIVAKPVDQKTLTQKIARHIPSWDSQIFQHTELDSLRNIMEGQARQLWEDKRRLWVLQCQMYSQAMIFNEIQELAEEIQQFGIQSKVSLLERWAKKLILATRFYNMTEIKRLLLEFEALPV